MMKYPFLRKLALDLWEHVTLDPINAELKAEMNHELVLPIATLCIPLQGYYIKLFLIGFEKAHFLK